MPSDEFILISFAMPNAKPVASSFPIEVEEKEEISRRTCLVESSSSSLFAKKIKDIYHKDMINIYLSESFQSTNMNNIQMLLFICI